MSDWTVTWRERERDFLIERGSQDTHPLVVVRPRESGGEPARIAAQSLAQLIADQLSAVDRLVVRSVAEPAAEEPFAPPALRCKCGAPPEPPHACPYAHEINADQEYCTCCRVCERRCAEDV